LRKVNIILVMGQAGSGKTTFAEKLVNELIGRDYPVAWLNADDVRSEFDDWDFSIEGRHRAAKRMHELAVDLDQEFIIIDMICPTKETRSLVDPNFIIFMDTIQKGRFDDTNKMFQSPPCDLVDVCFKTYPDQEDVECVADKILTWL
jgi:adenylylsulfate kinase